MLDTSNVFLTGEALKALSGWSATLKTFQQKLGKHFARSEARLAAFDYVQALVSPVERKNGWQMAEQVGYANPSSLSTPIRTGTVECGYSVRRNWAVCSAAFEERDRYFGN